MLISPSEANAIESPVSFKSTPHSGAQSLLTSLRGTYSSLEEIEGVLLQILFALGSVPSSFKSSFKVTTDVRRDDVLRVISTIQHIILSVVLPTWITPLREAGHEQLVREFFCPSAGIAQSTYPAEKMGYVRMVVSALPTLLSHLSSLNLKDPGPAAVLAFSLSVLEELASTYPLDIVHHILFSSDVGMKRNADDLRTQQWEDYVRSVCSVPGRTDNALQGSKDEFASRKLEYGRYFTDLCISTEKILYQISKSAEKENEVQSLAHLLVKLMHLGLFPGTPPSLPSQPSFFSSTLSIIQRRLHLTSTSASSSVASSPYTTTWASVVNTLPLTSQQTFLLSLIGALDCKVDRERSAPALHKVQNGASLLRGILGKPSAGGGSTDDNEELWSAVLAATCGPGKTWDLGVVRAIVCWIADAKNSAVDEHALERLLDNVTALWTNPDHIRHSLLSQHRYTTSLLLIIFWSFPPSSQIPNKLALSPPFIASISTYLNHLDIAVRRCGMLVAEIVAKRCGQKLEFGGWDGPGDGLEWARTMRTWQPDWCVPGFHTAESGEGEDKKENIDEGEEETPASGSIPTAAPSPSRAVDSDDESLVGYESPGSSRTPSPTPSELEAVEKDPSLRVGRGKPISRPVYLAQLVALLRLDKNDDRDSVERMEIALESAEALIRRKKGFGLELEENAVEITLGLMRIRDNYDLEGFSEKRQSALVALVECCPRKVAPTLIEQFFSNQYSMDERFTMLNALTLGARTLAGLPVPPPRVSQATITFPSKMLPPALHKRYATPEENQRAIKADAVQNILEGITKGAIERSREEAEDAVPEIVRERKLRVGALGSSRGRISEVGKSGGPQLLQQQQLPRADTTFIDVAAESFIMPLVNHMWLHVRDVETRASRRIGAGMGIVLIPAVLAQYLGTLAVLVHAARYTPAFLSVVVPGVVEIGVTLGVKGVMGVEGGGGGASKGKEKGDGTNPGPLAQVNESAVLMAALELVLIALDGSVELDGGRVLGLEHTALVLAVGDWGGSVLSALEKGAKVSGGGGESEGRVSGAAAGVVIRVDKIVGKWGRSMVRM